MRRTGPRQSILDCMLNYEHAVSFTEIQNEVQENVDRVTIYRILTAFEEHGLVHRIVDGEGVTHYALCSEGCDGHEHHDEHVHFHCDECGHTYCLHNLKIPSVALPQGFQTEAMDIHARGICSRCSVKVASKA